MNSLARSLDSVDIHTRAKFRLPVTVLKNGGEWMPCLKIHQRSLHSTG